MERLPLLRRIDYCAADFRLFLEYYARHTFDDGDDTGWPRWFEIVAPHLQKPGPWEMDVATFRGSAKSTLLAEWFVLYKAIFDYQIQSAMIIGGSAALAQERGSIIRSQVVGNQRIIDDFGELAHPVEWAQGRFVILKPGQEAKPLAQRTSCVVLCVGAGAHLRGRRGGSAHRPDLVLKDDVQRDMGGALTAMEFEQWEKGVIGEIGSGRRIEINIGNLTPNEWLTIRQRLEGKPYCNHDGSKTPPDAKDICPKRLGFKFKAIDDNGSSMWPQDPRFTLEKLKEKEREIPPSIWAAEFQNDPIHPATATFVPELFTKGMRYGLAPQNRTEALERWSWTEEDGTPKTPGIFAYIDLAISKRESADYTAIATILKARDGRRKLLDVVWGHWSGTEMLDRVAEEWLRWEWVCLGVESNAWQQAAQDFIEQMNRDRDDLNIIAEGRRADTDKVRKIETLVPRYRNGDLQLADDHDLIVREHIVYRPNRTHDDVLDAIVEADNLAKTWATAMPVLVEVDEEPEDEDGDWYRGSAWMEA